VKKLVFVRVTKRFRKHQHQQHSAYGKLVIGSGSVILSKKTSFIFLTVLVLVLCQFYWGSRTAGVVTGGWRLLLIAVVRSFTAAKGRFVLSTLLV